MDTLLRDLRYARRVLAKRPAVTAAAVLCLGLGIGATTAVFSLVSGVLLRPMPYEDPDRLYALWTHFPAEGRPRSPASGWEFLDFRRQDQVFEEVSGMLTWFFNLTSVEPPVRVIGARASASLFRLLGLEAAHGRTYTDEEEARGDPVVVLGHGLWQRAFGGDPGVVGRQVSLGPTPYTIVGVLPSGARPLPAIAELWVPLVPNPAVPRNMRGVRILTRLADDVGYERARADLDALERQFTRDYPDLYPEGSGWGLLLQPLRKSLVGNVRGRLLAFLGAVGLVLLIACANVANLLLAQATGREKEIALRAAFGAGRRTLLRQLITESVALAAIGGALGLGVAYLGTHLMVGLELGNLPRLDEVAIDAPVLVFALAVSLLTGVGFGLAPALRVSAANLQGGLREGGKTSASVGRHPLRAALVVAEVALAVVVLVGTGLMLRSFRHLQQVDPGFRTRGVVTMELLLPPVSYPADADKVGFYRELRRRLSALPGIESAGLLSHMPLGRARFQGPVLAEGGDPLRPGPPVGWRMVSPEIFETLEIRLLAGRAFTETDQAASPPVVIVDAGTARRLWGEADPVGQRLKLGSSDRPDAWRTVVGVVGAVRQHGLETDAFEQLYLPFPQYPVGSLGIALRTAIDPTAATAGAREVIRSLDPRLPLSHVGTMEQRVADSLTGPRFNLALFAIFGGIAFTLAAVGIYGVLAYSVAQRFGEIGLRRALGARRRDVLRLIVGEGLKLTVFGLGLGLGLALLLASLLSRVLAGMVHGVATTDAATFVGVGLALLATAFVASFLPASKAARIDPMAALRQE